MMRKLLRTARAALCLTLCVASSAQTPPVSNGGGWFSGLRRPYKPRYQAPTDFSNSNRLERLMRAGYIYLSLQDAIALALENNLDIEAARYGPREAEIDMQRASAGQLLRGVNTGVRGGATSAASAGVLSGANLLGSAGGGGGGTSGGILSGLSVQLAGAAIPNLDPILFASGQFSHNTRPQTSRVVTGTNFLVSEFRTSSVGIQKGFLTGTTVTYDWNNTILQQNSPSNDFNPTTSADMGISINQRLLQGFGLAVNTRAIRVARNNRNVADLVFQQQVIATVSNVVQLYYDLVSFNEELKVRRQALSLSEKLYRDNRRRVEIGTAAPVEIVQAEAEVAASQQSVTNAETQVLQQEMILKNVLTRTGVDSLLVADARIVPTTPLEPPAAATIEPIQDLMVKALENRPELEQARIQLENSRISITGTRSSLLPSLDVFASVQNNALAGQVNNIPLPIDPATNLARVRDVGSLDGFFLGGYGTAFSQLLRRNFPDYSVGFSLTVPLRNRSAQADLARDQLNLRQQEIAVRQAQNNIRLTVLNARIGLDQARAAYETSVKARELAERTLRGEQTRYELGTSTILNVVIVQRDLATRHSGEVSALSVYIRAKNSMDLVTGQVLKVHDVQIDEAYRGVVARDPALLPVLNR